MSKVTYYVALPFLRAHDGELLPGEAKDAPNGALAKARAAAMVGKSASIPRYGKKKTTYDTVTYVGAVAFSRTGDPEFGEFDDAVILARYGETPEG